MKSLSALFFLLAFSPVIMGQNAEEKQGAVISFETTTHSYGVISQGVPVAFEFKFKNTGDETLWIKNVEKDCGCQGTEWPEGPIRPGETASVRTTFDAAKAGKFIKKYDVLSNATEPVVYLEIRGVVEAFAKPTGINPK